VRKRIAQQAAERRLTRFLTLTFDPKKLPAGAALKDSIAYPALTLEFRVCRRAVGLRCRCRATVGRVAGSSPVTPAKRNRLDCYRITGGTAMPVPLRSGMQGARRERWNNWYCCRLVSSSGTTRVQFSVPTFSSSKQDPQAESY